MGQESQLLAVFFEHLILLLYIGSVMYLTYAVSSFVNIQTLPLGKSSQPALARKTFGTGPPSSKGMTLMVGRHGLPSKMDDVRNLSDLSI